MGAPLPRWAILDKKEMARESVLVTHPAYQGSSIPPQSMNEQYREPTPNM